MTKAIGYGLAVLLACAFMTGCGGGDGVDQSTQDQLQADLEAAQAELARLERAEEEAAAAEAAAKAAEAAAAKAAEEEAAAKAAEEEAAAEAARIEAAQAAALKEQEDRIAKLTAAITALATARDDDDDDDGDDDADTPAATTPATPAATTPATSPSTTPTTPAATTPTPTTNTLAANTRSQGLLDELEGAAYTAATPPSLTDAPTTVPGGVVILPPANHTSAIRLLSPDRYTVSTFSVPSGYIGRRFTDSTVGKETLVVITDIEASRRVLDHHFMQREGTSPELQRGATRLEVGTDGILNNLLGGIADENPQIRISHGFPETTTNQPLGDALTKTAASYAGSIYPATTASGTISHRVSGRFECGGAAGCMVTLTAGDYTDNGDGTFERGAVTLGTTAGQLYFRPTTTNIPLDGTISIGGTAVVDTAYMTFGYWLTEPPTEDGEYDYQVFAIPTTTGTTTLGTGDTAITASFNGTAVGVYVEQGGTATDLSKRQGQFTASVGLKAASGMLSGEIVGFRTTAGGGSGPARTAANWRVNLAAADPSATPGATPGGTATITGLPGAANSEGNWRYSLVGNHAGADPHDNPSAAVGMFDTRIEDLLHLSGAFGAKRD